jgi:hypothetical protein
MIYENKKLNYGFIILCSDRAVKLLQSTARSIKNRYEGIPYICATDDSAKDRDLKEMQEVCPTFKGKDTFSSLINTGIKNSKTEWNFIVFAGSTIRPRLDLRFFVFVENESDILFPIAENKYDFISGTLNGILINKKTYKKIGNIGEEGSLEFVKTIWACKAIEKGCTFKAIANTKIC